MRVYLETGRSRVFAAALDWPGWCRSGRDEQAALTALIDYAERYAPVATAFGFDPLTIEDGELQVVARLPGSTTTDFGAPDAIPEQDREPVDAPTGARLAAVLQACWELLDQVAAGSDEELRKGPRGGGRDRTPMLEHVIGSEFSYARKVGVRHRPAPYDDRAAVSAMRAELLAVIASGRVAEGTRGKPWPIPYAARRIAWHVLDHAWEMQDRRLD